jgi:hypothetical protein
MSSLMNGPFRFAANGLGGMALPIIVERLLLHYGSATTLRAFAVAAVRAALLHY